MRKGDVLVMWRLDRLVRSVRQLVGTAADLHAKEVELRSLHDAIDTSTATGRLTFHLFAALDSPANMVLLKELLGMEHAGSQEREACSSVHGALDHLEAADLAFHGARVQGNSRAA